MMRRRRFVYRFGCRVAGGNSGKGQAGEQQHRQARRGGDAPPASGRAEDRQSARASLADRHVGTRIRERRVMLGLSQQQLAQMIGVTYQQAHKYERGLNRISAGRLYEIAQVLKVPVSWFFEGLARGERCRPR